MIIAMTSATIDRFGRIVIPRALRQRHGWRPGTELELRDGPGGLEVTAVDAGKDPPPGWAWVDGLLVCTATATGNLTDLAAIRDGLDVERDRVLGGFP